MLVARLVPLLSDAGRSGEALPLLLGAIPKARYNPELRVLLATDTAPLDEVVKKPRWWFRVRHQQTGQCVSAEARL